MVSMSISEFLNPSRCSAVTMAFSDWKVLNDIKNLLEGFKQFTDSTKIIIEGLGKAIYYITHPKILALDMWNWTVKYSFWICMFMCLFGIIAYLIGWKKGKKWAKGSFITYIIIMMFNIALS